AQVNDEPIILILDSRSLGCVVSAGFLKKAGIQIDQPSTIMMVGVHEEQKRPIEKIDQEENKKIRVSTEYCKPANIDSNNDDEFKKENLVAKTYLYYEFWPIKEMKIERKKKRKKIKLGKNDGKSKESNKGGINKTGDTSKTGNIGDTGDTSETGNTSNTGETSETDDTSNTTIY
ncbi:20121_t:CDS:2, partial [Gigaspora margarita]